MIDTGPRRYVNAQQPYYDVAKTVILPFLRKKGINKIDILFITHFDLDHYGGLLRLADSIKIKLIAHNGNGYKYPWFKRLTEKYHIKTQEIKQNDVITLNKEFSLICLNPPKRDINALKKNNASLVLKAVINDKSILFTGDIHQKIEKELIFTHNEFLKSDILKVAHHGSKSSSSIEFFAIC